jgi:hypothetical protein
MKHIRFSMLGLLGVVVASALAFAALRKPTFHAASLTMTAVLTILLFALLAAKFGRYRTFAFGFAVFGWGYAVLALAPGFWTDVRPYLIASHLLGDLANLLGLTNNRERSLNSNLLPRGSGLDAWFMTIHGERFQRIGHSLFAVLHGVFGGFLAVWIEARRKAPPHEATDLAARSSTEAGVGT